MRRYTRSLILATALAASLVLTSPLATAQTNADPRSPVDQYRAATQVGLAQCKLSKTLNRIHADAGEAQEESSDYTACLRALKVKSNQALPRVLKTVKKAKLKQAILAYHKVYAAALAGVPPNKDEAPDDYEQRQLEQINQVNAAWEEVESQR